MATLLFVSIGSMGKAKTFGHYYSIIEIDQIKNQTFEGEFSFHYKQLIEPEKFTYSELKSINASAKKIKIPGRWNQHLSGGYFKEFANGYATYLTILKNDGSNEDLYLRIGSDPNVYRVFIVKMSGEINRVLDDGPLPQRYEDLQFIRKPRLMKIGSVENEAILIVQQASFLTTVGGWTYAAMLGDLDVLMGVHNISVTIAIATCVVCIFFFVFGIVSFAYSREQKGYLYGGLISLASFLYIASFDAVIPIMMGGNGVPSSLAIYLYRLELFLVGLGGFLIVAYTDAILVSKVRIYSYLKWLLLGCSLLYCAVFSFLPTYWASNFLPINHLLIVSGFLLAIGFTISKAWKGNKTALILLGGYSVLLGALINDVVKSYTELNTPYVFKYAIMAYLLSLNHAVSYLNAVSYKTAKRLTFDLEKEVDQKTLKISEQKKVLEEQKSQTENLIRVIVHDIANSLMIIEKCVDKLERDDPSEKIEPARYLQRIGRASSNLAEILEHVREIKSVESGKKAIKLQSVDLVEILGELQFLFSDKLKEKNLKLSLDAGNHGSITVLADPVTLLNSVLSNLLSNAIKFSLPSSRIDIKVMPGSDFVSITIKDYGVGIPNEKIPLLFDRSVATSSPGTAGEKGTGFGLPIVKSYVEAYGGTIEAISETSTGEVSKKNFTQFEVILKSA